MSIYSGGHLRNNRAVVYWTTSGRLPVRHFGERFFAGFVKEMKLADETFYLKEGLYQMVILTGKKL